MEEKFCFLCQESKNEVGHTTESCPNVTCRTCGLKGHSVKYCPDLNLENYKNSKKSCRNKQISKDSEKIKKNSTFDNPFLNVFSKYPGREDEMDINANRIKSAKNEEESAETLLIPTEAKNPNSKQLKTYVLF